MKKTCDPDALLYRRAKIVILWAGAFAVICCYALVLWMSTVADTAKTVSEIRSKTTSRGGWNVAFVDSSAFPPWPQQSVVVVRSDN
jgi:cytosine/uracil/thiamine/allantoin permease